MERLYTFTGFVRIEDGTMPRERVEALLQHFFEVIKATSVPFQSELSVHRGMNLLDLSIVNHLTEVIPVAEDEFYGPGESPPEDDVPAAGPLAKPSRSQQQVKAPKDVRSLDAFVNPSES